MEITREQEIQLRDQAATEAYNEELNRCLAAGYDIFESQKSAEYEEARVYGSWEI